LFQEHLQRTAYEVDPGHCSDPVANGASQTMYILAVATVLLIPAQNRTSRKLQKLTAPPSTRVEKRDF